MTEAPPPPPARPAVGPPRFRTPRLWREGYAAEQVDAFVAELDRAVRHDPPTMAPYEVADQRFRVRRRGRRYDLRAVDDHLDEVQAALRERHGGDPLAALEGRLPEPRHLPTWPIYVLALLVVAVVVAFAVTQL